MASERVTLTAAMLYDAGREDGRRDAAAEIARLTRELEEARERERHIERQIVALVEAEVISEGKAREILGVGVDEWREIEDRTLGVGTDT